MGGGRGGEEGGQVYKQRWGRKHREVGENGEGEEGKVGDEGEVLPWVNISRGGRRGV